MLAPDALELDNPTKIIIFVVFALHVSVAGVRTRMTINSCVQDNGGAEMDPLDAFMAALSAETQGEATAATTADARAAVRSYRGRQPQRFDGTVTDFVVRNRRYIRLQQLLADTRDEEGYFSDAMMQQRSPALFHLHLGQYRNVASRQQTAAMADNLTLSSFLMETCDRQAMEARRVAEQRTWGEYRSIDDTVQQNEDEEEEEEEDEEETKDNNEERSLEWRREQLIELMSQRFLDGCDVNDVDYTKIDADDTLDDMVQIQRDAEERYFDSNA